MSNSELFNPESQDHLVRERGKCMENNCAVRKLFQELQECETRLINKPYTAETCHQETVDMMEALDHCVGEKAFVKLA